MPDVFIGGRAVVQIQKRFLASRQHTLHQSQRERIGDARDGSPKIIEDVQRDLAKAQIEIAGGATSNQALASVPAPSGAGDIAWWGFTVLAFAGLVYYAVRRRQV